MTRKQASYLRVAVVAIAAVCAPFVITLDAQQPAGGAVRIDGDDIGGVVSGPAGPEAGVWVIAETTDLPTRFARSVVTDDQGRYVVPDLPKARYKVWVRGYGLVDSPKVDGEPGKQLNLSAVPAPNAAAAAQYYPAIYWYSMLKIPDADQFGGRSGIPANVTQQRLAHRGEESSLRRLSSARPAVHPHDPGRARPVRVIGTGVDPPRPVRPGGAVDADPAGPGARRRSLQVLRRLDRPRRPGRAAAQQAPAAPGGRAQHRRHDVGVG